MMTFFHTLQPIALALYVGAAVFALSALRLKSLLRLYAICSFGLALFAVGLVKQEGGEHLYVVAVLTLVIKVVAIPMVLSFAVKRSGASSRLQSSLRATPSLFLAIISAVVVLALAQRLPFGQTAESGYALALALVVAFMGMLLPVLRRDIFSQIVGFLFIENGIAAVGLVTVVSLPYIVEMGIFSALLIGSIFMALLSENVQQHYGAGDTAKFRELTD